MSLEEEILAAGRRVRDLAHEGALKVRQSKLVQELEKIEDELAQIASRKVGGHKIGDEPVAEEQAPSAPKAAPKKAEPKTAKTQPAKSTSAKS